MWRCDVTGIGAIENSAVRPASPLSALIGNSAGSLYWSMENSASASGPSLEHTGESAYFTDRDGVRWRVYDVCFGPPHCARGRRKGARPPDPRANYRWFVSADGTERCVKLEGERPVTAEVLARQLAQSSYVARQAFNPSSRDP